MKKPTIEKISRVLERVSLSRSSIYRKVDEGTFPKPVPLGDRAVGWLSTEIDAWIAACAEKRSGKAGSAS